MGIQDMPVCDGACPSLCNCAEANCEKETLDCVADSTCATGKQCADKCACGDMDYIMGCMKAHPSPLGPTLLGCVKKSCMSGFKSFLKAQRDMPVCDGACPSLCNCAEANCQKETLDCVADSTCATGKQCADKCACGDMDCIMGCMKAHPSPLGPTLLGCVKKSCMSGFKSFLKAQRD